MTTVQLVGFFGRFICASARISCCFFFLSLMVSGQQFSHPFYLQQNSNMPKTHPKQKIDPPYIAGVGVQNYTETPPITRGSVHCVCCHA